MKMMMSGAGGVKLLSDANASGSGFFSAPAGGSITVSAALYFSFFENTSGVALRIASVSTDDAQGCPDVDTDFGLVGEGNLPYCATGSTVQPDASCYVRCNDPNNNS